MPSPRGGPGLRPLISTALTGVSQFTADPAGAIEQEKEQDISTIIIQVIEGEPRGRGAGGSARPSANRAPHRDETRIVVFELARERRTVGVVIDDDIPPCLIHRDVEWNHVLDIDPPRAGIPD